MQRGVHLPWPLLNLKIKKNRKKIVLNKVIAVNLCNHQYLLSSDAASAESKKLIVNDWSS